jgi:hypothetical protein
MKFSRALAVLSVGAFLISHFLPAFLDSSGFACERLVWSTLFTNPIRKAYFAAFALTNALFVVLAIISFTSFGHRSIFRTLSIMMLAHVLSWFALVAYWYLSGEEKAFHIRIGYYLWATAFAFLVWVFREKKSEPNQSPEPTSGLRPAAAHL